MRQILKQLKDLLRDTDMSYDEVKAFEAGISGMDLANQVELYRIFKYDTNLIYATYIHYKAKLRAKEDGTGWEEAVENEIKFLDNYLSGRIVGTEIK
jgi:hypothetical protein